MIVLRVLGSLNHYLREKKKLDILILILAILNPFIYLINPILLVVVSVIEVGLVFLVKEELYIKFWKAFLLSITFYGVTIFHIKLYYWVFGLTLPFIVYKYINRLRGRRLAIFIIYGIYIVYLGVVLLINPLKGYSIAEYIRYLMSFAVLFITLVSFRGLNDVKKIFSSFRLVSIVNIISGLLLTIFAMNEFGGIISPMKKFIFSIDIYLSLDNFRLASFFSDPNLYYAFFIILLAIYEFINFIDNKDIQKKFLDKTNIFLIISVILSFSRIAIIAIVIYLVAKFFAIYILKSNLKKNNIVALVIIAISIISFVFFSKPILNWINWIVYNFTIMIGRKHALSYSSNFTNSSRVISWKIAINSLKGHWILGRGLNFWKAIYYMPPHNSFIMLLQSAGVIGCTIFTGLLIYSIRKIPIFISLILVIFPMCTLDLQDFVLLVLFMGIGVIFIDDSFNNYSSTTKYLD